MIQLVMACIFLATIVGKKALAGAGTRFRWHLPVIGFCIFDYAEAVSDKAICIGSPSTVLDFRDAESTNPQHCSPVAVAIKKFSAGQTR
ncbi:MAG: hypothetical protein JNM09_12375 [Blastocatellia bacterium]|nr:hypothetical protein [Blastocatellia bacterium]